MNRGMLACLQLRRTSCKTHPRKCQTSKPVLPTFDTRDPSTFSQGRAELVFATLWTKTSTDGKHVEDCVRLNTVTAAC
eukprot:759639-Hanusia_phi.AAC.2